jgi:ABC-type transport system involved in multi-copper enzyme maturation permease subunit
MNKAIAIARREIEERVFVFVAAAVITIAPLLSLVIPRGTMRERFSTFAILSVIFATAFVGGLSMILGASIVGRELTEKRLSFYFSRPLSGSAIWFGKLTAAIAMVVGCAAIVFTPSLFFLPRVSTSWVVPPAAFGTLFVVCMLLMFGSHALSTMFRSRSPLLALDFAAAIAFIICIIAALVPLAVHHAAGLNMSILAFVGAAFVMAVAIGGARQLSHGRIDVRRNHLELSRFLWLVLAATVVAVAAFALWVTSATHRDLRDGYAQQAPAGSWVFASGKAAHRLDYETAFLIDSATGASIEVPPQFQWFGNMNESGTAAVWVEPVSPVSYMFNVNLHLRKSGDGTALEVLVAPLTAGTKAHRTGIFVNGLPSSIDVTPDLSRIAYVSSQTLTVFDANSRKSLGSVRVGPKVHAQFASPDRVLITTSANAQLRVDVFDVANRKVETLIDTPARGSSTVTKLSADGRTLLVRTFPGRFAQPTAAIRLFDAATGREIASIDEPDLRFLSAWLTRDGRLAVTCLVNGNGHLRLYSGASLQRDLDLGPAAMIHIDAVKTNGQFIVSKSDINSNQRLAMLVDIDRGVVAQAAGLMAIAPTISGVGASEGREITPLFLDTTGQYVTWNPATGERKRLL